MKKDLVFFSTILILALASFIGGFIEMGTPWLQQKIQLDEQRISKIRSIQSYINGIYRNSGQLPENLNNLNPELTKDPGNGPDIVYKKISETEFQLCTTFDTVSNQNSVYNPNTDYIPITSNNIPNFSHDKGYYCLTFQTSSVYNPTYTNNIPTRNPAQTSFSSNFESWNDTSSPAGWQVTSGSVTRTTNAYDLNYAAEFGPENAQSVLTSNTLQPGINTNYKLTLWYNTESTCKDCFFVGLSFIDGNNQAISSGVANCGTYNVYNKTWMNYISGPTKGYEKYTLSCKLPTNTKSFNIKVGIWNASDKTWSLDNLQMTGAQSPSLMTSATKECPTSLVDGVCKLNNCEYSYPNDIYTRGYVIVGDYYKNIGQPTGKFYDECTDNNTKVSEVVCSGNPKDPYNMGKAIYICPKGCANGACIE